MITVTLTKRGAIAQSSLTRGVNGLQIFNLRPTTEGNLSTAAIFEVNLPTGIETWTVSETYSAVLAAITADTLEAGAEVATNKATDFSTLNDTLYPTTKATEALFAKGYFGTTTNSGNAYSVTLAPARTTPVAGMTIFVKINAASTGSATLNIGGGAVNCVKKNGSTAVGNGDFAVQYYPAFFDGTNWVFPTI